MTKVLPIHSKYANYYPLIFKLQNSHSNIAKECDFIEKIFKVNNIHPDSILDLGCAIGRLAGELNRRGYKVTGVDASNEMLTIAKKKYPNVIFFQAEMQNVQKKADVAIIWWTTYNYLTPTELKKLFKHLQKKVNYIILDSSNYPLDHRPVKTTKKLIEGDTVLIQNRMWVMRGKKRILKYKYKLKKENKETIFTFDDISYWYPMKDLKQCANSHFKLVQTYGGYASSNFNSKKSKRMITVWKKRDSR